jgi:hypothetical protein
MSSSLTINCACSNVWAAMLHEKPEHVTGAQRPHPMLVRKKAVIVRKRRRR